MFLFNNKDGFIINHKQLSINIFFLDLHSVLQRIKVNLNKNNLKHILLNRQQNLIYPVYRVINRLIDILTDIKEIFAHYYEESSLEIPDNNQSLKKSFLYRYIIEIILSLTYFFSTLCFKLYLSCLMILKLLNLHKTLFTYLFINTQKGQLQHSEQVYLTQGLGFFVFSQKLLIYYFRLGQLRVNDSPEGLESWPRRGQKMDKSFCEKTNKHGSWV